MSSFQRSSCDRVQKIYRYRIDFQPAGRIGEVENIIVIFAHPNDTATASGETRRAHVLDRRYPVVPAMSGADARIKAAAGVEVVIDPSCTRALERDRLLAVQ